MIEVLQSEGCSPPSPSWLSMFWFQDHKTYDHFVWTWSDPKGAGVEFISETTIGHKKMDDEFIVCMCCGKALASRSLKI